MVSQLLMALLCPGEVPSFQEESEEMKELLQAHRVNLATSQNLRSVPILPHHMAQLETLATKVI